MLDSGKWHLAFAWGALGLCGPAEIGPMSRDRCSNAPVALCSSGYRKLSLLHPLLPPPKGPIAAKRLCKGGGITLRSDLFGVSQVRVYGGPNLLWNNVLGVGEVASKRGG